MEFSQTLKVAMESKSITMYRLAKELGIHQTTIKNWLDGKGEPRISEIYRLANALQMDPYSLMSFDQASEAIAERINARERVDAALNQLNDAGMEKAADAVEVIAEVPRYRATPRQGAAEHPPTTGEGTDTPLPEPPPETAENGG